MTAAENQYKIRTMHHKSASGERSGCCVFSVPWTPRHDGGSCRPTIALPLNISCAESFQSAVASAAVSPYGFGNQQSGEAASNRQAAHARRRRRQRKSRSCVTSENRPERRIKRIIRRTAETEAGRHGGSLLAPVKRQAKPRQRRRGDILRLPHTPRQAQPSSDSEASADSASPLIQCFCGGAG